MENKRKRERERRRAREREREIERESRRAIERECTCGLRLGGGDTSRDSQKLHVG